MLCAVLFCSPTAQYIFHGSFTEITPIKKCVYFSEMTVSVCACMRACVRVCMSKVAYSDTYPGHVDVVGVVVVEAVISLPVQYL